MQPLPASAVVSSEKKEWWEHYEQLVGQKMICAGCYTVQILALPALEVHPPKWAHLGAGKRWYVNGCKQGDKEVWFFICPKCQGKGGKNINKIWDEVSEGMQKRARSQTCPRCKVGAMFPDDGEMVCLQCGCRR